MKYFPALLFILFLLTGCGVSRKVTIHLHSDNGAVLSGIRIEVSRFGLIPLLQSHVAYLSSDVHGNASILLNSKIDYSVYVQGMDCVWSPAHVPLEAENINAGTLDITISKELCSR